MENNEVIIKIEHLSKSYDGTKVLNDINLEIKKGEFVTLLGPSGSGKSTLLRTIAGFVQPDGGSVSLEGNDLLKMPPYKRPLNTVFQHYALFPHLNVFDNVAFGLHLHKVPKDEVVKRVKKVLKMVCMSDYEERDVNSLSGGQQQRVAIARALINQPKVLLLDEPLAALDLQMRKDMQMELKEMHKELGITFIYVTHDQEEALTLSDTIVVLNEGNIMQIGSPIEIYNEPQNAQIACFIGDSNIFDSVMIDDHKVRFCDHDFDCVDEGFGQNTPVDVVVRPEDVYVLPKNLDAAQLTGVITSCTFKGVHYEMFVNTDEGYEMMIQDYNAFEVGSRIGMIIKPEDIQVMKKRRFWNTFDGEMVANNKVKFLGKEWDCECDTIAPGTKVKVEIGFDDFELLDNEDGATLMGQIKFQFWYGKYYHLKVMTEAGMYIYTNTDDVWDKNDIVGIRVDKSKIKIKVAE